MLTRKAHNKCTYNEVYAKTTTLLVYRKNDHFIHARCFTPFPFASTAIDNYSMVKGSYA